ncbi:YggS family pyridoxal phosphate-dependent enzyme [Arundinibacter roseus]|uniref:Pyridoxal phosphate homeostasis protein n=1 Tax=Arundinibacter roseus TaxID=2070510 RepID=A0A4V2X9W2_9BACT|nr:YggS family pyridoxal phosphate-dependent enzyme [Arundinibacter roseus]TDB65315.1 YggS family pyridoxal phosphate-dependent enzyme [Arundinibacter roseus]
MDTFIKENILQVNSQLGTKTKLIAVTKTKPVEVLMQAYQAGCTRFGENKVQEMTDKYEALPKDIDWHMIGHLQTNKVKYIAPFVALIHSVDSLKLLSEINKQALKNNRVISCLLQIYIAKEDTKFGLSEEEAIQLLQSPDFENLKNIQIVGLMGMATDTDNQEQIRAEFRSLRAFFESLREWSHPRVSMAELSMGMSGDFPIAVEEGSTLVRVGSAIFGKRN